MSPPGKWHDDPAPYGKMDDYDNKAVPFCLQEEEDKYVDHFAKSKDFDIKPFGSIQVSEAGATPAVQNYWAKHGVVPQYQQFDSAPYSKKLAAKAAQGQMSQAELEMEYEVAKAIGQVAQAGTGPNSRGKQYVPRTHTANWAFLVLLYAEEQRAGAPPGWCMGKDDLLRLAADSGLCPYTSIFPEVTPQNPFGMGGWVSLTKGLVKREPPLLWAFGKMPVRVAFTEAGREVAARCYRDAVALGDMMPVAGVVVKPYEPLPAPAAASTPKPRGRGGRRKTGVADADSMEVAAGRPAAEPRRRAKKQVTAAQPAKKKVAAAQAKSRKRKARGRASSSDEASDAEESPLEESADDSSAEDADSSSKRRRKVTASDGLCKGRGAPRWNGRAASMTVPQRKMADDNSMGTNEEMQMRPAPPLPAKRARKPTAKAAAAADLMFFTDDLKEEDGEGAEGQEDGNGGAQGGQRAMKASVKFEVKYEAIGVKPEVKSETTGVKVEVKSELTGVKLETTGIKAEIEPEVKAEVKPEVKAEGMS